MSITRCIISHGDYLFLYNAVYLYRFSDYIKIFTDLINYAVHPFEDHNLSTEMFNYKYHIVPDVLITTGLRAKSSMLNIYTIVSYGTDQPSIPILFSLVMVTEKHTH